MSALEAVHELSPRPAGPERPDRALQGLYERHADRIFGFCRRRLRSHQEAEDAVQTTFLHAFRALQRGVVPLSETAWLFKIAENVCLSAHRSNGRRGDREVPDGEELVARAPSREDRNDALFGLESALAAIPARQRRAFVLRELRGLSYREIAVVDGVTVAAVETLVFRARRSLARALENGAGLKGRVSSVLDLGAVVGAIKSVFGGAAAVKVLAAAAVVTVATVPAGDSVAPARADANPVRPSARTEQPSAGNRLTTKTRVVVPAPAPASRPEGGSARPGERAHRLNAPPAAEEPSPGQEAPAPGAPAPPVALDPVLQVTAPVAAPKVPDEVLPKPLEVADPPVNLPKVPELPPLPVELPRLTNDLPQSPTLP